MISRFAKSLFIIVLAIVGFQVTWHIHIVDLLFQFLLAMLTMLHPPSRAYIDPWTGQLFGEGGVEKTLKSLHLSGNDAIPKPIVGVEGGVIMAKLGNETAKYCSFPVPIRFLYWQVHRAALGRATWKFLCVILYILILNSIFFIRHTMTLRFPEVIIYIVVIGHAIHLLLQHPTRDEREALDSYFRLTSRLYPCGECAEEFQELLKQFPPQVSDLSCIVLLENDWHVS